MKDTKEREIVALRDELTARCEAVESELAQRSNRCVHECPCLSQGYVVFTYSDKFYNLILLTHSSHDGCTYSLTKSEAKYVEMKNTKEREIVDLRNELTASKGRCEAVESELARVNKRYVCDHPYYNHGA